MNFREMNQSVCHKNNSTNNSIELEKGQIHSDIIFDCVSDERIAEIPSDHKIQISYRKKERSVGIAKHSIIFF